MTLSQLVPGFNRQMSYSTVRIAVYEWIKRTFLSDEQLKQFTYKFIAGGTAGAVGCVIGNPSDILKIRYFQR